MNLIRATCAIVLLATAGALVIGPAGAQQKKAKPSDRPIIINDRSIFRPPPQPHDRTYVGPGPTVVAPMERLPRVAPLAQPPIR